MSKDDDGKKELPKRLEGMVPTAEQIFRALGQQRYSYELDSEFVRAVDNEKYVATASPFKAHRFGPPLEFVKADGSLAFTWVYLARDSLVASWESQVILNNRGAGNGFHITRKATERGVLARIRFKRELVLWNLGEDHSSRLGIQDIVSSSDHEACQWLGLRLREAMLRLPPEARPDGFAYPSRRVRGAPALALGDWATTDLFEQADVTTEAFVGSDIHAYFMGDPMRTEPPDLDAPPAVAG
ncbi:RES domain-containing protein [Paraburkholderia domus]|uniref:RES domain-containing protein n=1 Tax=Paraburkholderia domus TaxID=2793075 RepID=A0A9N8N729_9BURK|nr:RES domain-containing protein [Paraburkholderia domus]MBK5169448.1 RES domain-containing protein [Burkholderia sp. R-70211]CAE6959640.1 hypothetical protein R70211_06847 [Paraburkholderia domus]